MKNLLSFLFPLLPFFSILQAQSYEPMAVEEAHWIMYAVGEFGAEHHAFSIEGDTMIGGVFYKKMYRQQLKNDALNTADFKPPYLVESQTLIGVIRDDFPNKKVYYQSFTDPLPGYDTCDVFKEVLLYDFSISEGDALEGCLQHNSYYPNIVDSIASQFLFGKMRKSFFGESFATEVIEAIGTGLGPFWTVHFYIHPAKPTALVDYCVGKYEACGLFLTPARETRNDWGISIYPNPAEEYLNIELPPDLTFPTHIHIYDIAGKLLFNKTLNQQTAMEMIGTATFPKGVFQLFLQNKNGSSVTKFVIN